MAEIFALDRWDDELTDLTERVRELFGEEVLGDAMKRAIAVARPVPLDPLAAEILLAEAVAAAPTLPLYAALKVELRRLLTPQ